MHWGILVRVCEWALSQMFQSHCLICLREAVFNRYYMGFIWDVICSHIGRDVAFKPNMSCPSKRQSNSEIKSDLNKTILET